MKDHHETKAYSVTEAAAALRLSRPTLHRMLKRGELASLKIGDRRIIPAKAIDDLLAKASCVMSPKENPAALASGRVLNVDCSCAEHLQNSRLSEPSQGIGVAIAAGVARALRRRAVAAQGAPGTLAAGLRAGEAEVPRRIAGTLNAPLLAEIVTRSEAIRRWLTKVGLFPPVRDNGREWRLTLQSLPALPSRRVARWRH